VEKVLSSEEVLASYSDACFDAMKRIAEIDGVNVHAGVEITAFVTAYVHAHSGEDGQATREKVYQIEMELMEKYPAIRFKFEVR
jgi:hypothetical protein